MDLAALGGDIDGSGNITLINDDVIAGMSGIPDESVNLIVTSPPYWTAVEYDQNDSLPVQKYDEYIDWMGSVWSDCFRVLQPNGKLVINTPIMPIPKSVIKQTPRHLKNIFVDVESWILNHTDFNRYSLYIWQKQTSKAMFGSYPHPPNILENNTTEFIAVYVKPGAPRKMSRAAKDENLLKQYEWMDLTQQLWFMYPADVKRGASHPAPFPQKLPARFMKMYSFGASKDYEGDVVLDPFNGAGTTAAVAKMLRRRCIGIELSPNYHRIAKARVGKCLWGQDLNWLVGRPSFMKSEELEHYRAEKEAEAERRQNDGGASAKKAEAKHKKKTYGRSVQLDLNAPGGLLAKSD